MASGLAGDTALQLQEHAARINRDLQQHERRMEAQAGLGCRLMMHGSSFLLLLLLLTNQLANLQVKDLSITREDIEELLATMRSRQQQIEAAAARAQQQAAEAQQQAEAAEAGVQAIRLDIYGGGGMVGMPSSPSGRGGYTTSRVLASPGRGGRAGSPGRSTTAAAEGITVQARERESRAGGMKEAKGGVDGPPAAARSLPPLLRPSAQGLLGRLESLSRELAGKAEAGHVSQLRDDVARRLSQLDMDIQAARDEAVGDRFWCQLAWR